MIKNRNFLIYLNKITIVILSFLLFNILSCFYINVHAEDAKMFGDKWFSTIAENSDADTYKVNTALKTMEKDSVTKLNKVTKKAASYAAAISIGIGVFIVAYAGLEYALAAGDPARMYAAKQRIIFSTVGLSIIMLAGTLVEIFATIVGV